MREYTIWAKSGQYVCLRAKRKPEGLQTLPNGDIFAKAAREQRIVLTFDLDFGEILAASGKQVSG